MKTADNRKQKFIAIHNVHIQVANVDEEKQLKTLLDTEITCQYCIVTMKINKQYVNLDRRMMKLQNWKMNNLTLVGVLQLNHNLY